MIYVLVQSDKQSPRSVESVGNPIICETSLFSGVESAQPNSRGLLGGISDFHYEFSNLEL